jgi:tetraacyldisaccharide 4'-kinase
MRDALPHRPLLERLWQRDLPTHLWPLWAALTPASALYSVALAIRERWWRSMTRHAGVTTISVGNLTVGGNGKTPFTLFLAVRLRAQGLNVGIVSRGWGRRGSGAQLVSDGARILLGPDVAGDEPVMMAKCFDGPIAVARRRIDAIKLLTERFPLDVVILDDGFQHVRLKRDLDLVLVNAARGFGNGWVLPAGPMREPSAALRRADAMIIMGPDEHRDDSLNTVMRHVLHDKPDLLRDKPILRAMIRPRNLVHAQRAGWRESPLAFAGRRVLAVSGLADASGFHAMLRELGANLVRAIEYPDHHDYGPGDWENIVAAASDAEMAVTTEKDLVKLERFSSPGLSLYALRLEVSMDERDESRLFAAIMERIRRPRVSARPAPLPASDLLKERAD